MLNYYIINEDIEFHPATSTLRNIHNPRNMVALNSPSGRCLLLLINRLGEVVTQNEFMDFVWKQRGLMVTSNTYYQSISILRKGLKSIGMGDDLIVTIPRIGLTLASETRIRKLSTDKGIDINYKSDNLIETPELIHKETISSFGEKFAVSKQEELDILSSHRLHITRVGNAKFRRLIGYILMFSVIFSCTFFVFLKSLYAKKDFFSDYTIATTLKKCNIFLPSKTHANDDKKNAIRYADRYIQDCQEKPAWIYVTIASTTPRTSVIRCDKPFYEPTTCTSVYFIE